ncbi:MAG: CorA family divalent cation transporter, partial [Anaerovoracaceae bacterium]
MENVAILSQVKDYRGYIDSRVIEYIAEGQTETFESFGNFNLLAFDWYDISCPEIAVSKIMIYFDREILFFFCEDQRACNKVKSIISDEIDGEITKETSKEKELYLFFVALLRLDMNHLDEFELAVTRSEDEALTYSRTNYLDKIIEYRKELLRLKRYYEQLVAIFDNLSANDNGLISHEGLRYFTILGHRAERFHQSVLNIRDYITQ